MRQIYAKILGYKSAGNNINNKIGRAFLSSIGFGNNKTCIHEITRNSLILFIERELERDTEHEL